MKFYIRSYPDAKKIIQLIGRLIEIPPYGKFFVDHRHYLCDPDLDFVGYAITEPETGYMVTCQMDFRDTYEYAKDLLDRKGMKKLARVKKDITDKYGVLNDIEEAICEPAQ